jgi:hypothetical protein
MWEVWAYDGQHWVWLVIGAVSVADAISPDYAVEFDHPSFQKLVVCQEHDRPVGAQL